VLFACGAALAFQIIFRRGPTRPGDDLVFVAIMAFVVGRAGWDAWAWLAATDEERAEFRQYVANVRLDQNLRRVPPGGGRTRTDWSNGFVLALAAATAGCFALIRVHPAFFVGAMFALAFLIMILLDRLRDRRQRRAGAGRDGA
jgi:hypothetical protein